MGAEALSQTMEGQWACGRVVGIQGDVDVKRDADGQGGEVNTQKKKERRAGQRTAIAYE